MSKLRLTRLSIVLSHVYILGFYFVTENKLNNVRFFHFLRARNEFMFEALTLPPHPPFNFFAKKKIVANS